MGLQVLGNARVDLLADHGVVKKRGADAYGSEASGVADGEDPLVGSDEGGARFANGVAKSGVFMED